MSAIRFLAVLLVSATASAGGSARAASPQAIVVGTEGSYAPFTFTDDKGQLTGYDVEVVRELARRVGLEARFVPTPWDSMFLALESKKFDLIANQIAKNPERERKYLFSEPYLVSGAQIIVKGSRPGAISGLADLAGLRVGTGVGSNYGKLLEEWNARSERKMDIQYYDGDVTTVLQDIVAGRLDATLNDRLTVGYNVQQRKLNVKAVGEPIALVPSHFVVRKGPDGEALLKKVDQGLAEMRKDGTLSRLSQKWFGADYTK